MSLLFHDAYIQMDSSSPSCNISVINDVMKVGILAVDIDTRDEGSGVQSVDLFYQIAEGNGKSVVVGLRCVMYYAFVVFVLLFRMVTVCHTCLKISQFGNGVCSRFMSLQKWP